jgi:hypothetical protein
MKRKPITHVDPYQNQTVEEIIESCRQAYFRYGCDKFKDFGRRTHESYLDDIDRVGNRCHDLLLDHAVS